jgi:hypothetical protein
MAVVHVGCCTSLLYGMPGASKWCPCSVDCLRRCKRTRQRLRLWLITLWRRRHVMAPAHPLATCAVSLRALHLGSATTIEGAGRAVYRFGKLGRRLTCLIDLLKPIVVVPDSDGEQAENATAHAHPTSVPGLLGSCKYKPASRRPRLLPLREARQQPDPCPPGPGGDIVSVPLLLWRGKRRPHPGWAMAPVRSKIGSASRPAVLWGVRLRASIR